MRSEETSLIQENACDQMTRKKTQYELFIAPEVEQSCYASHTAFGTLNDSYAMYSFAPHSGGRYGSHITNKIDDLKLEPLYDLFGEQILVMPHFALKAWHRGDLTLQQVTRCMKKRVRKTSSQEVVYNPGDQPELDGHCAYACMAMICRKKGTLAAACQMRAVIKAAWMSPDQQSLLSLVAGAEGLTSADYIAAYVEAGWGGIPELYQCARIYGARFDVWNSKGQHIACVGSRHARVQGHLCYEQSHYAVIKDPQQDVLSSGIPNWRFARRGGGGGSDSRSPTKGSPTGGPIKLVSRTERIEKEREEELRRTDTRPPLARKRKDPPADPPSRSSLSPPLRDAPEPPPEPKMQRSEKSKQKVKVKDEKKKSRREEAEKAVKVESKAMPYKRPLPEQKATEPSEAGSQGKELQKLGKETKMRAEDTTGSSASTRPGDALPSNTEPRTKKAANQEFGEDHPYYRCILKTATGSICSLCGKWLDSAHLASVKHRKNYESYLEYSEENRQIFARSCVTWALENMVQPARGGAAASSIGAPESVSSGRRWL